MHWVGDIGGRLYCEDISYHSVNNMAHHFILKICGDTLSQCVSNLNFAVRSASRGERESFDVGGFWWRSRTPP